MRKKPNLIPRMERCAAWQVKAPEELRGRWLESFGGERLWIELGCGKGRFTAGTAAQNPDCLIAAVERVPDAMVVAMERAKEARLPNVRFIDTDAAKLELIFAPGEADRIYINFCDPWPTKRHAKRRLTSPLFLASYKNVLRPGGEIHFKTDNLPLFEYSLEQFSEAGFTLTEICNDLHASGPQGVMTDYELKFAEQGIKINRCVAVFGKDQSNG